ncbi:MAG TPA: nucleotidyl transferase AbiEii/AbiGii toxin family protein [Thermoanaerobaculia bacterium]|nr:nucleotidyl transferase AbiEii/AbiGii toxin family protein [Thermoanaerobaculia bacterium]
MSPYRPEQVIPQALRPVVEDIPYWFVIGGHAVRCLCPYRPTRDVDFGVEEAESIDALVEELRRTGDLEILERSPDTVHLRWNAIDVSLFHLESMASFTEERRLTVEGILATKLHAILDRGARRDFFDLYVVLQRQQIGIAGCLRAIRTVYRQDVNDSLLLRALTYFDDADREAPLPAEGDRDWERVKDFFRTRVGHLLVPPTEPLEIQEQRVDVDEQA